MCSYHGGVDVPARPVSTGKKAALHMTSKSPQREEIPQAKSSSNTRAQNAKRGAEWLLDEHDLRAHQLAVDVGRRSKRAAPRPKGTCPDAKGERRPRRSKDLTILGHVLETRPQGSDPARLSFDVSTRGVPPPVCPKHMIFPSNH